jgi:hypothetical protein
LKTLFHIHATEKPTEPQTLLLEVGPDHASYAFLHPATHAITQLKYYAADEFEMETALRYILEEVRESHFNRVLIGSAYPYAMLTPLKYRKEESLLSIFYDQPGQHYLSDSIAEWQMINAYSIPANLFELLTVTFPSAQFVHAYTPSIKNNNGFSEEDRISIHFTTQNFSVLVKKRSHVLLAQTYTYKTPLDVVYYLLKICSELQLSQSETRIILSGLIEENSALYKELYTYFLHIQFAHGMEVLLPQNEYPQHFFTSFYNLATCVS